MVVSYIPSLLAVGVYSALLLYVASRRPSPPLWPVVLWAQLAGFAFCLGDVGSGLAQTESTHFLWLVLEYTGVYGLPLAWLQLSRAYSEVVGRPVESWLPLRVAAAISLTCWLGLVTNPLHGQFFEPHLHGRNEYHWWWWAGALWSYGLLIAILARYGSLILDPERSRSRARSAILFAAVLLPLLANLYYVLVADEALIDPTIAALGLAGLLILIGIHRLGLFEMPPVALRHVIERDADGVVLAETDGQIVYSNAAARALDTELPFRAGENLFETLSAALRDPRAPSSPLGRSQIATQLTRAEGDAPSLYCLSTDDRRWLRVAIATLQIDRRRRLLSCRLTEATELQQVREESAIRTAMLEGLLGSSKEGLIVLDANRVPLYANDEYLRLWNIEDAGLVLKGGDRHRQYLFSQLKEPALAAEMLEQINSQRDSAPQYDVELIDGRILQIWSHPISQGGEPAGRVWHLLDVTEARMHDEELRRLGDRLAAQQAALVHFTKRVAQFDEREVALLEIAEEAARVLDVERVSVWLFDSSKTRLRLESGSGTNPLWDEPQERKLLEAPSYFAALEENRVIAAADPSSLPAGVELFKRHLEPLGIQSFLDATVRFNGEVRGVVCHQSLTGTREWHPDEQAFAASVADAVALVLETQQRRQTQQALMDSEARYRDLVEKAPLGIVACNPDGELVAANHHVGELLGDDWLDEPRASLLRHRPLVTSGISAAIEKALEGGGNSVADYVLERTDGVEIDLRVHIAALLQGGEIKGAQAILEDVTERKRNEAALRHAQKLESIGVLAGGIAHDFNNLLVGVLGHTSLLLDVVPDDSPYRASLQAIEKSARSASDLTQRLLAYSGKSQYLAERFDLRSLAEEMDSLLRFSIGKNVTFELDLCDVPAGVEADRAQLRQLMLNLVTNASDAIGENEGTVRLTTDVRTLAESEVRTDLGKVEEGRYVVLAVSDDGCGMTEEIKAKIFDPFFTTKFTGRGLGMAAVLGIVQGHRGAARIDTAPSRGTTFTVFLPAVPEGEPLSTERESVPDLRTAPAVLVVDDDPTVREVACSILEMSGMEVATARDGIEAVEAFQQAPDRFSVVLLDMTMPRMNGAEALRELRKIRTGIAVVLSSGFAEDDVVQKLHGEPIQGFVQKPYSATTLASTVKRVAGRLEEHSKDR